jgi:hypothetical protein
MLVFPSISLGILARLKKPLDFAAIDGQPTRLNASPAYYVQQHTADHGGTRTDGKTSSVTESPLWFAPRTAILAKSASGPIASILPAAPTAPFETKLT